MASAARRLGAVFNLVFVATSLLHVIYAEVEPRRRSFATVSRSNFVPLMLARHRRESSSSGGTPSTGSEDATAEATETTIINAVIPWDDDAGGDLTVQVTFGDEKPFRRLVYGDFDRRRMIFRNDSFVVTVGQGTCERGRTRKKIAHTFPLSGRGFRPFVYFHFALPGGLARFAAFPGRLPHVLIVRSGERRTILGERL